MSGSQDPINLVPENEECFTLKEAQLRSDNGRAYTIFSRCDGLGDRRVYWHRTGKLPERDDAQPACAGGSRYWREILAVRDEEVWSPDQPLNAMEVIAKAYGTDEPMFAIMRS